MDSKGWGQLQLISHSPYTAQHTIWTHPALAQLPSRREGEVGTRQEHLLAHRQLQSLVVRIKVMLLVGLGMSHTLPGQGQMLTDHSSYRGGGRGLWALTPSQINRLMELLPKHQHISS